MSRSTQPAHMLALATAGFMAGFWAWALLGPLGPTLREDLGLSSFEQSLVVAVPVLVGSLGRIPVGALTDRVGARRMFPLVTALTVLPVLYLGHLADSLAEFLVGGFFLGLGGTTFAVGVPFVNAWYPPERRGLALGIFGIGTGGTAVSAFTTVQLADAVDRSFPFTLVAVTLAGYAVTAHFLLRDQPERAIPGGSLLTRTTATLRMPTAWQLAFLYAVAFGGFVAFSVYLPTYLTTAYGLGRSDASLRTAGFVVLAVAARPAGGWLSDRLHPVPVLIGAYATVAALALLASLELPLVPIGTLAFLGMAAALGAGSGAVFALVARLVPADRVGSVTGVVGAAGGLGGFFPPLVMGAVYSIADDYTWGYLLLALTAAATCAFTATVVRHHAVRPGGHERGA
ncbi:NarK/NasA family nitrate transporter [Streptomyces virens]|uniref:NNP family nitrate/nitrite transporter-like MFS transporter n=3 Tax=Streptomyces TaxID=1883 RepID=A0AA40SDA2_9ACTN|nr:NNP family nitrate/nitrite transporter-like MFS transporter [Streptomyces calvus]MBA8976649.1 NNP family nitrate/nitrite transporter-like MFS transporter [Streptomyces calvus]MYS31866.1 MFS transporter [Streptomyces sp. SID7804]GGP54503.1 MFS transporter [Streptomyces calvus]